MKVALGLWILRYYMVLLFFLNVLFVCSVCFIVSRFYSSWIGGVEGSNATIGILFKIKYILCVFGVTNVSLMSLKKSKD